MFTIEDAKRVQRDLKIADHVAYVSGEGFVLAHADFERANGWDLTQCRIHQWLASPILGRGCLACFKVPGWYRIEFPHAVEGLAL